MLVSLTSLTRWNSNRCSVFLTNHLPYSRGIFNSFPNCFFDFYRYEVVFSGDIRKNGHAKERCANLLHVSDCETLHFVTSYMNQNKKRDDTQEEATGSLHFVRRIFSRLPLSSQYFSGLSSFNSVVRSPQFTFRDSISGLRGSDQYWKLEAQFWTSFGYLKP